VAAGRATLVGSLAVEAGEVYGSLKLGGSRMAFDNMSAASSVAVGPRWSDGTAEMMMIRPFRYNASR